MTFENNRAPFLSNIKLYVSFHHHMWIQTGVRVRKRLSWVVTSVTLTFDVWPWPFAWTLPWSLVITLENFMMIRWWEHSKKGVTDGQTVTRGFPSQRSSNEENVSIWWRHHAPRYMKRVVLHHVPCSLHELTLNVRGPGYLGLTRSISWLLMLWLLTSPGHQQPWYWLPVCWICRSWSYLRKDIY